MKYSRNHHHQYHHYHRIVRRNRNYGRFIDQRYNGFQSQHNEFQAHQPNFNYLSDDDIDSVHNHRRYVRDEQQQQQQQQQMQQHEPSSPESHVHEVQPTIRRMRRSLGGASAAQDISAIIAADIVNPNRRNGHKRRLKRIQK